jgi:enoyl-CoA hydratase/carnithine racemase
MSDDVLMVEDQPGGKDGIRRLTLNRPERRNALSPELVLALTQGLAEADDDPAVRAVIVTGAGDKAFCAGGDLAGGMQGEGFLQTHEARGTYADLLRTFRHMRTPTVAAVNGMALGGGFGLVLACDLAVGSDDAKMGTPEIRRGLFPMMISRLIFEALPQKAANQLVLLGETITGGRAAELGLLNQSVGKDDVQEAALAMAEKVAGYSHAVMGLGKRAIARQRDMPFSEALSHLHDQLTLNLLTEDAAEGIAAFFEKRDPVWRGR